MVTLDTRKSDAKHDGVMLAYFMGLIVVSLVFAFLGLYNEHQFVKRLHSADEKLCEAINFTAKEQILNCSLFRFNSGRNNDL